MRFAHIHLLLFILQLLIEWLESAFLDTSSYDSSRALDKLPEFLKTFTPDKGTGLAKSSEQKGTPHTLVVSGAALRAADVVRYGLILPIPFRFYRSNIE